MKRVETFLSCLFGYMFLALSFFVTAETILRKVANFSFQGADELGGYALAVGSALAFTIALIGRSHIRIDILHQHFPRYVQAVLNWVSAVLLAGFGLLLVKVTYKVVVDTMEYQSTAPTPWATPLIFPQGIWFITLSIFCGVAILYALKASKLIFSGRFDQLNEDFHPKGAMEELSEEIQDLSLRSGDSEIKNEFKGDK